MWNWKLLLTPAQIDIFQIYKNSSGKCWSLKRASVQSILSVIGNYFKSILFFPSREAIWVLGQSAAPWEGMDGVCQSSDLQKDTTDPSDASMRFITWHGYLTLSSGASICLLEFACSHWGSKVRTRSLVVVLLRSLKRLIKIKRDCLLSAFWQPWQNCSSNLIIFWFLASSPILFSAFQRIN